MLWYKATNVSVRHVYLQVLRGVQGSKACTNSLLCTLDNTVGERPPDSVFPQGLTAPLFARRNMISIHQYFDIMSSAK